jgi:hypothetical protein
VNDGLHRTPLVPSCLKALQYVLPRAVGAAQCRLSNEVNSLGCAAQYERRARADAQLRIDWKVRHGYLTPSCVPSSLHLSLPKTFEPTIRSGRPERTYRARIIQSWDTAAKDGAPTIGRSAGEGLFASPQLQNT